MNSFNNAIRTSVLCVLLLLSLASAHDEVVFNDGGIAVNLGEPLVPTSDISFDVVSNGSQETRWTNRLELVGRGERVLANATTDVWVHDAYAYIGTFMRPCGDGEVGDAGVQVFDVRDPQQITRVGSLPSVDGSRVNDVKVMAMNGGNILVHSNERCRRDGAGGFEVYNVNDPLNPVHLAHVQTDIVNKTLQGDPDHQDEGVHNLYLFSRDGRDYVAAQVYTFLGNFQIFDITDPENVTLMSSFGPEVLEWPNVDWVNETDEDLFDEAQDYIRDGFGQSANRYLHDHYVTDDGMTAYLAHWDAGLIRLDLSDLANPEVVSVALEPLSEDGEVNSHSVWPSEDGRTVVEGEEDFDPYSTTVRTENSTFLSVEGPILTPVATLPGETLSGPTLYVGQGCEGMPEAEAEDHIALILRGGCTFTFKTTLARQAGYAGVVVFNGAGDETLIEMGGDAPTGISGAFVGHSAGLKVAGVDTLSELEVGTVGQEVTVGASASGWSGLRIWDYSDPANPVLASTFNTLCSAYPDNESCLDEGIYSSHNLIVEGNKVYVSWYAEGVLILDISDPYNPVEIARFKGADETFEEGNGGVQDVWGIHKLPGDPLIYASDRNGGLYVLEERTGGERAAQEPSKIASTEVHDERQP